MYFFYFPYKSCLPRVFYGRYWTVRCWMQLTVFLNKNMEGVFWVPRTAKDSGGWKLVEVYRRVIRGNGQGECTSGTLVKSYKYQWRTAQDAFTILVQKLSGLGSKYMHLDIVDATVEWSLLLRGWRMVEFISVCRRGTFHVRSTIRISGAFSY